MSASELDAFNVVYTVLGISFFAQSYLTWAKRDCWDEDRARCRKPMVWLTGRTGLNFEIAMGVFFLGIAVTLT
ncbi:hypothetical protein [Streptomyces sp. NRRL S-920]|uniref:hypothetical protein n=1 Tax=Streptomyces sp. NRRL S-920 TaxID=1463921 RepID=UPI0004C682C7|nr:hypothetical protein [Streptomyces sp. NRRL S-920]